MPPNEGCYSNSHAQCLIYRLNPGRLSDVISPTWIKLDWMIHSDVKSFTRSQSQFANRKTVCVLSLASL